MADFDTQRVAAEEPDPAARHLSAAEPVHDRGAVRRLLRDRAGDEPALRPGRRRDLRRDGARRPRRPRRAPHADAERVRRRIRQPVRHGELRRGAGAHRLRVGAEGHGQARLDRGVRLRRRGRAAARALQRRCWTSPTSAGSPACPVRRPRRWSRASSGSSTTYASIRSALRWWAWAVTLFAGLTMVSNIPYYSFKTINLKKSVPFLAIFVVRAGHRAAVCISRQSSCSRASWATRFPATSRRRGCGTSRAPAPRACRAAPSAQSSLRRPNPLRRLRFCGYSASQ